MQHQRLITPFVWLFLTLGFLATTIPLSAATPERLLHSFCSVSNCSDGAQSWAALIFDTKGNLYGTTAAGGLPLCTNEESVGCGTVFKLSRGADGHWTETVLYSFCSLSNCTDGANPYGPLTFDSAGNLYGTTAVGGSQQCDNPGTVGCGVIFELTNGTDGQWTETVLHTFCSAPKCADGANPYSGLIFDSSGNLYGTTADFVLNRVACQGASSTCGKVFQLRPGANGHWTYKVLHAFHGKDGAAPELGNLIFDMSGNLYGTTSLGGRSSTNCPVGCGTVFELSPNPNHHWIEKVLYSFVDNGHDGYGPIYGVVFDTSGNLYGTTFWGGRFSRGTVFRLSPGANGRWIQEVLRAFDGSDGAGPGSGVILDGAGNLYGNTNGGGANGRGVVFRLSQSAGGTVKERLYSFQATNDGAQPAGNLVLDSKGNVYGTTFAGGLNGADCDGCGTVYEITP